MNYGVINISIIIPVYNCEKYIDQCINSVLSQTIEEKEIICIDDGSKDHSAERILQLSRKDKRIRLLQQENQGPGVARNLGIKSARGKYIAFLDADDYYLERDALEKMYHVCEKKRVKAGVSMYWKVGDKSEAVERIFRDTDNEGVLTYQDCQFDYNFTNYIFQREALAEKNIFFPNYQRYEDPPFLAKVLYALKKFAVVDTCLYAYRIPEAGVRFDPNNIIGLLKGIKDNLNFASGHDLDILFDTTLERLEYEYAVFIRKNCLPGNLEILELLMEINRMVNDRYGITGYVIRPLRLMQVHMEYYEKELLKKIKDENRIALYGAGKYGKIFLKYLETQGLRDKVKGIVVSSLDGNVKELNGIPVIELEKFLQSEPAFLLVTVWGKTQEEIENGLKEKDYENYTVVNDIFLYYLLECI